MMIMFDTLQELVDYAEDHTELSLYRIDCPNGLDNVTGFFTDKNERD